MVNSLAWVLGIQRRPSGEQYVLLASALSPGPGLWGHAQKETVGLRLFLSSLSLPSSEVSQLHCARILCEVLPHDRPQTVGLITQTGAC